MPTPCTVTGNLGTLLGGNAAFGSIDFVLGNLGIGTVPRVIGTGIFPALRQTVQADENGHIQAELWGNDNIDPANTVYLLTFRDSQRNEVGQVTFIINGISFNLNTAVAANTILPPVMIEVGNMDRLEAALGTPLSASDFGFSGWGAGATISNIKGTDTWCQFTITAGSSPTSAPTVTLAYHDGSWIITPICTALQSAGTGSRTDLAVSATPTNVQITYLGLPVNSQTYTFVIQTVGSPS
jgi:hypothetical protein